MAESMVSIVVGIVVLAVLAIVVSHQWQHWRRAHPGHGGTMHRFDGHRWWDRMRHRH